MKQHLSFFLLILAIGTHIHAAGVTPDFAKPQTVMQQAQTDMSHALRAKNGEAYVDAIIRYTLAQTSLDADNFGPAIRYVSDHTAEAPDSTSRSLLHLLQAKLLTDCYLRQQYIYDRRPTVTPQPELISQWSGNRFREAIMEQCSRAIANPAQLQGVPVTSWSHIIEVDRLDRQYFPSMLDFVAFRCVELLTAITPSGAGGVLPISMLDPDNGETPPPGTPETLAEALRIARLRLDAHRTPTPARVSALGGWFALVADNLRGQSNSATRRLLTEAAFRNFEQNAGTAFSVEFLLVPGIDDDSRLYHTLTQFAGDHPAYYRINAVREVIDRLSQQTVTFGFPQQTPCNSTFTLTAGINNIRQASFGLYLVPDSIADNNIHRNKIRQWPCVKRFSFHSQQSVPFSYRDSVLLTLSEYGRYVICSDDDRLNTNLYPSVIVCSDLAAMTTGWDGTRFYTVDWQTGHPLKDVAVSLIRGRRQKNITHTTGDDGLALFDMKETENGGRYTMRRGQDRWAQELYTSAGHSGNYKDRPVAYIRPALPLYHPGDTIDFVAVCYTLQANQRQLLTNKQVTATLTTPDGATADTITLITDSYGRAMASLAAPTGGVTGDCTITLRDRQTYMGQCNVTVSDYKLPTFEVGTSVTVAGLNGAALIEGNATSYAGTAVSEADVALTLYARQPFSWRASAERTQIYYATVTTAASGSFTFELPSDILGLTPYDRPVYEYQTVVSSQSGEIQTASGVFTLQPDFGVQMSLPPDIDASSAQGLRISVCDALGERIDAPVTVRLHNGRDTLAFEGKSTVEGVFKLDFDSIPSGTYTVEAYPTAIPANSATESVVIYRPTDRQSPTGRLLFTPITAVEVADGDDRAELLFWCNGDNIPVLLSLFDPQGDGRLLEERWITAGDGRNTIQADIPAEAERVNATIRTFSRGNCLSHTYTIQRQQQADEIVLEVSTLRDHLIPGCKETITITTADGLGTPTAAPLLLGISNKALLSLSDCSYPFTLRPLPTAYISYDRSSSYTAHQYQSVPLKSLKIPSIGVPTLNLYGRSFGPATTAWIRGRGSRFYRSANTAEMKTATTESVTEAEDAVVEMNAVMSTSDAGAVDVQDADLAITSAEINYRPSEIPLALFSPMLVTGSDGKVSVTFDVPDANTTWQLDAVAYNPHLFNTATVTRLLTAGKPVMVQPNRPRFVRTGDKITLMAAVIDNGTESDSINAVISVSAGGNVIAQQSNKIASGLPQSVVSLQVDVLPGLEDLTVSVSATDGRFTDGERFVIPVLPSAQTVTEANRFVIKSDQSQWSLVQHPSDSTVTTLKYCQNPVWEVVKALPSLSAQKPATSTGAAEMLFSSAVEYNLASSNAGIATLIDKAKAKTSIEAAIEALAKSECENGGWSWMPQSNTTRASEWVTTRILTLIGQLKRLGYMPDDARLSRMTERGLSWLESQLALRISHDPKATSITYTRLTTLFPNHKVPTMAQGIVNRTVQSLASGWSGLSTPAKAMAAIILTDKGYRSVAKEIIRSLDQFSTTDTDGAMHWLSVTSGGYESLTATGQTALILEAYGATGAPRPTLDAIRLWLLQSKQVQTWGNSADATQCIAAILRCGTDWCTIPVALRLYVDGDIADITDSDRLTGAFTQNISDASNVRIDRPAGNPAFGAVLTQSIRPMTEIAPSGSDQISITKQTLRHNPDGTFAPADTLRLGEIVKVQLLIRTDRDMDYLKVDDNRAACLEPVIQTPRLVVSDGAVFYLENRDAVTNLYIDNLPRGEYLIEYEMKVNNAGVFSSGVATMQSQMAPEYTAHSGGSLIEVN